MCMKNFILGFTCLGGASLSALIIKCAGLGNPVEDFTQDDFIVASMINGAQISSSFAVQFTGFPLMALAKSSKIIPVMVIGQLRGVYKIKLPQVLISFGITTGLVIFSAKKFKDGFGGESAFGIFLLVASLVFDGISGTQTDKTKEKLARPFAYHSMFYNNSFGLLVNMFLFCAYAAMNPDKDMLPKSRHNGIEDSSSAHLIYYAAEGVYERLATNPELLKHVLLFAFCGSAG